MAAGGSKRAVEAMAVPLQEKARRVISWLKKIFENQPVPHFQVNTPNIDLLYVLVEYSEERQRDTSFLIEDMKRRAAEYDAEAEYLQSFLTENLNLSPSMLSKEGTAHLNTLVDSAMILGTKDTYLSSFLSVISDRSMKLYAAESENKELEHKLLNVKKKLTATLVLEKQLGEDLEKEKTDLEVEEAKCEIRMQNLQFLKDKSEDIKKRIRTAEGQIIAVGLNESLMHGSLVSLSEKLAEMQKEVAHVKKKLQCYLSLPPSISLARVKVEEAKRELNALEEEFSRRIEVLTNDWLEMGKL